MREHSIEPMRAAFSAMWLLLGAEFRPAAIGQIATVRNRPEAAVNRKPRHVGLRCQNAPTARRDGIC